jgi:hypothetical protein
VKGDTSKIERAKALKAVRDILPDEAENPLDGLHQLAGDPEIERSIEGLKQEDEFALLCRLMGTATHCVHLEQRPVIASDSLPLDFLCRFLPGSSLLSDPPVPTRALRCLVEVKSTVKNQLQIGGSLLARRRRFADTFGLPLLIAVRFLRFGKNALWVIVPDDPSRTRLTISYGDWLTGLRPVLWNDYFFMVHPGLTCVALFDSEYTGPGVVNEAYGTQRVLEIHTDRGQLTFEGLHAFATTLLMESFELEQIDAQPHGNGTRVTFRPTIPTCSVVDAVYNSNRRVRANADGDTFDASRVLVRADAENDAKIPLVNRFWVEAVAAPLVDAKRLLLIGAGDQDHLREQLQRLSSDRD